MHTLRDICSVIEIILTAPDTQLSKAITIFGFILKQNSYRKQN